MHRSAPPPLLPPPVTSSASPPPPPHDASPDIDLAPQHSTPPASSSSPSLRSSTSKAWTSAAVRRGLAAREAPWIHSIPRLHRPQPPLFNPPLHHPTPLSPWLHEVGIGLDGLDANQILLQLGLYAQLHLRHPYARLQVRRRRRKTYQLCHMR